MSFPIEKKLVIGISTTALFDLSKEDKIFNNEGLAQYNKYQKANTLNIPEKGDGFSFIQKILRLNAVYPNESPVEVVILSQNSPEISVRIFHAIEEYRLKISRAVFSSGKSPYKYIPAFNISLFLSQNKNHVLEAIQAGHGAGRILGMQPHDYKNDHELRIAFDYDGVLADDEGEKVFQQRQDVSGFHAYEKGNAHNPHNQGPLHKFFQGIAAIQQLESQVQKQNPDHQKIIHTALITARDAPAHQRVIRTFEEWGVGVDELFLLGGISKRRILEIMNPDIFFDDQMKHLSPEWKEILQVHVPFGITNK